MLLISTVSTGFTKYLPFITDCGDSMGEWDRYFWLGLGAFSGLFLGHFCWLLLVDDGVPLEIAWGGGLRGWARVADFALYGVSATYAFIIYHSLVNVLRFLVSGFYMWSLCILAIGKLA